MATTPPPPPPPPTTPPYCTVVPGRQPKTKMHATLGHARAAVGVRGYGITSAAHEHRGRLRYCSTVRGGAIYELVDGAWSLLHDVAKGTPRCEVPWRKEA